MKPFSLVNFQTLFNITENIMQGTVKWIADFEAANSAQNSESGQRADPEQNTTEGIDHTHCPSIKPSANRKSTK